MTGLAVAPLLSISQDSSNIINSKYIRSVLNGIWKSDGHVCEAAKPLKLHLLHRRLDDAAGRVREVLSHRLSVGLCPSDQDRAGNKSAGDSSAGHNHAARPEQADGERFDRGWQGKSEDALVSRQ